MKFATIPLWTRDRAIEAVDCSHVMAFPMPGKAMQPAPIQMTKNPFIISIQTAVKWWWRVKEWILVANISDIGTVEITMRRGFGNGQEKQLCNPASYAWSGTYNVSEPGPIYKVVSARLEYLPPLGEVSFSEPGTVLNAWGPYQLDPDEAPLSDRLICPTIALTIFTDPMWDIGTEIVGAMKTIPQPVGLNGSAKNGTIDGVAWYGFWEGDVSMTTFEWTLTPISYFPWADSDGLNPTWDETTGARI